MLHLSVSQNLLKTVSQKSSSQQNQLNNSTQRSPLYQLLFTHKDYGTKQATIPQLKESVAGELFIYVLLAGGLICD
jgi:hypothetical protein